LRTASGSRKPIPTSIDAALAPISMVDSGRRRPRQRGSGTPTFEESVDLLMPHAVGSGTIGSMIEEGQPVAVDEDEEPGLDDFDPYRLAAVDSPTSREAMELEDLVGVPLS
jgi:hypothetical protein